MRHALEPISNGVMLPLGAFSAALVAIPQVALSEIPAPLWGTLAALPVGKGVGITLGGRLSSFLGSRGSRPHMPFQALITVVALGAVCQTIVRLMNERAFARNPEVADAATLAVLLGSTVSIIISAILTSRLTVHDRRLREMREHAIQKLER